MAATRKAMFVVFALAVVQLFILPAEAFLPNHLNGFLNGKGGKDFTHQDITEQGLLRVVARIMENSPRPGTTIAPGSLTSLNPLTPQLLFDKYYGAGVQATKLKSAIDEVVVANNRVDVDGADSAKHHFNGEQIKEGNLILQNLRDNLIKLLQTANPDYDAAREMVGKYLHTLQMFYSNTNWVEMHGDKPYPDLGITGKPLMAVAPPDMPTCKNCETDSFGVRDPCDGNILVKGILTSGYKIGQDVLKPPVTGKEGKCSHGGAPDVSRFFPATGGINKDTSDFNLSPHADLHKQAAKAAIEATVLFFDNNATGTGLRQIVGDTKVKELLNMGSGSSVVLVIDISGSMATSIAAVKKQVNEIITKTAGTPNAPYNYILSTFSDPETIGSVRVTKDPTEIKAWNAALTVSGGGDCPEYSMLGIERAVRVALPNSKVYVFTDADAKDPERLNGILAVVKAKKIQLEFLLTGTCTSKKRSRSNQDATNQGPVRQRRSNGNDIYKILAEKSGGDIIETDKTRIGEVSGTITEGSLGTTTPIAKFELKSASPRAFFIDDTVTSFSLHMTSDPSQEPDVLLTGPAGSTTLNITTVVSSRGIKVVLIKTPAPGVWSIGGKGGEVYSIEVKAATPFGISYNFLEEKLPGNWLPIEGNPVVGTNLTLMLETIGHSHIEILSSVQLVSLVSGDVIREYPLVRGEGRLMSSYQAHVILPDQGFRIKAIGTDKSRDRLERTVLTPIVADTVRLEVYESSDDPRPGLTVSVKFNLINYGETMTFTVKAKTDYVHSASIQPSSQLTLASGEIGRGTITIDVPSSAKPFTSTSLTVMVTDDVNNLRSTFARRMLILEPLVTVTTVSKPHTTTSSSVKQTTDVVSTTVKPSEKLLPTTKHAVSPELSKTTRSNPKTTTDSDKGGDVNIIINDGLGTWEIVAIATGSALGSILFVLLALSIAKRRPVVSISFRQRSLSDVSMVSTGKIGY